LDDDNDWGFVISPLNKIQCFSWHHVDEETLIEQACCKLGTIHGGIKFCKIMRLNLIGQNQRSAK
jgi:hypothetical protein